VTVPMVFSHILP